VPYSKGKELEIVKQLFDVALLIEKADSVEEVYNSYIQIATEEIAYRMKYISRDTLKSLAKSYKNNEYGKYLASLG